MDEAAAVRSARMAKPKSPEQIVHETKRDSLELSRTRVLHDLQTACNARYRIQLEQALAHLDGQIATLG